MSFPDLTQFPEVALDTETTSLNWWEGEIFGVSISAGPYDWYFDIRRQPEALRWLRAEVPRVRKLVCHNAKFDWHFCREKGIIFPEGRVECTMIRAALIDEHRLTYDLDSLSRDYGGPGKEGDIWAELAEMFGGKPTKDAQIPNLSRAPVQLAGRYAKRDTRAALLLHCAQEKLIEDQDLGKVHSLEMRLLPAMVRMEQHGVRVDVSSAERAMDELAARIKTEQRELDQAAGFAVNPNPSGSIKKLFEPKEGRDEAGNKIWTLIDGTRAECTDAGQASIDADCLRRMTHPAAAMILNLRKMKKARDTFLAKHVLSNHNNGYIHANYNQTKSDNEAGTGTGRLSVNGPALQQIPKRDKEMAAIVRAVFIPDAGHEWVCNDWAQMDFRVFSHYVNNPEILRRYRDDPDTDFHKLASDLTGLPRSPRFAGDPNAKQINLGLVFGMGQGRLAQEMGLPFTIEPNGRGGTWVKPGREAEEVFERYHSNIPGVRDLLGDASRIAKSRGFVRTMMGRRIRFPRGMYTHKAGGLIFQGTAADALKVKIIELDQYMQTLDGAAHLLLNVHDEFDHSIEPGRGDIKEEISHIVTAFGPDDVMSFRVPIRTDQGVGPNWHVASA